MLGVVDAVSIEIVRPLWNVWSSQRTAEGFLEVSIMFYTGCKTGHRIVEIVHIVGV